MSRSSLARRLRATRHPATVPSPDRAVPATLGRRSLAWPARLLELQQQASNIHALLLYLGRGHPHTIAAARSFIALSCFCVGLGTVGRPTDPLPLMSKPVALSILFITLEKKPPSPTVSFGLFVSDS